MLNARYIASLSDDIVKLYANLESEIKADMCKRIKKLGKNTDSIQWQADILSQTGALKSDIDKYITRYNEEAQKLVKSVFDEAMNKASSQDIAYYSAAKRELDSSQKQILETSLQRFKEAAKINKTFANRKKAFSSDETYEALQRMTLTVADSCQKKFLNQMNKAYMKVSSGAYSYDEAVKDAVDYLADRGVTSVFYTGSGRVREYSIESAVRMNVITGINQTASLQTLNNCEELGTDLVEVSAHIGARPEHEAWQGKIYSLSGNSSKYPAFSICRLGEADGICGINCRHSYYPYFEGTDPRYSKGELDEMSDKTVKLDNKDVTPYEAEQELRYTERQIRYWKDKVACYQYAGIDESDIPAYNAARAKLGAWQKRAQDICSETKIKRDYSREYTGTKNGVQPRGIINNNVSMIQNSVKFNSYDDITKAVKDYDIKEVAYSVHSSKISQNNIIKNISGGDMTRGSCSSAAFAYIGNKAGYNILDFRGGYSTEIFSRNDTIKIIAQLKGVKSNILENCVDDIKAANSLMKKIENGKQYYFAVGQHAAIVRKVNDIYEYLELQSSVKRGFFPFNSKTLKERFGCKRVTNPNLEVLIDIDSLFKNNDFLQLLNYINTKESKQKKGLRGFMK